MSFCKKTALLAIGAALVATSATAAPRRKSANPTLNSVNQPVVHRTDYAFDVAAGGGRLADQELFRLAEWFETLGLGYGDRVWLDTGEYDQAGVRDQVADVAADYGILLSRGAPVTAGAVQPGSARVIVSRSVATVPGCPNWEEGGEIGMRITTSSNFGCATNSNLAAMIADPNDLVLGQAGASAGDPNAASKAIKQYRNAEPTGAKGLKEIVTKGGQ